MVKLVRPLRVSALPHWSEQDAYEVAFEVDVPSTGPDGVARPTTRFARTFQIHAAAGGDNPQAILHELTKTLMEMSRKYEYWLSQRKDVPNV